MEREPEPTRAILLVLQYDGSDFFGWQRQGVRRTVQGVLEDAIAGVVGERVGVLASGRTDSGVHATGQVASFRTASQLSADKIQRALNATLPCDVRVRHAQDAPFDFHPTIHALSKRYRYQIDNAKVPDPLERRTRVHVYETLDDAAMHRAAQCLVGKHDFHSFETHWPNRTTSVRTISDISVTRAGNWVDLSVSADGFLYNMVRTIVGTLLKVGKGKWPEERVGEILEACDRRRAGPTALPHGLCLVSVTYPFAIPVGPLAH